MTQIIFNEEKLSPKHQKSRSPSGCGLFGNCLGCRVVPAGGLDEAFALHPLALQFAGAAYGFSLLAGPALGRLFIKLPAFHFPECAFALHLLFERAQGLLHIVFADNDIGNGQGPPSIWSRRSLTRR